MGEPAEVAAESKDAALGGAPRRGPRRQHGSALAFAAYCLIQGALLLAALLVRHPATGAICLTVATVGTLVFIVGVARHRPAPKTTPTARVRIQLSGRT